MGAMALIQSSPLKVDPPWIRRLEGNVPADLDAAMGEVLAGFDREEAKGSHPGTLTLVWNDAALTLDLASWQAYRQGKLTLPALSEKLQIQSSGEAAVLARLQTVTAQGARSPWNLNLGGTTIGPAHLAGCGGLLVVAVCIGLLIRLITPKSPKVEQGHVAAPLNMPPPFSPSAVAPPPLFTPPPLPPPIPPVPPPAPTPQAPTPQAWAFTAQPTALVAIRGPMAGQPVPLGSSLSIGREGPGNGLTLDDPSISRHHAVVEWQGTCFAVRDLGSSNGTFVNSLLIQQPTVLHIGDILALGEFQLRVQ